MRIDPLVTCPAPGSVRPIARGGAGWARELAAASRETNSAARGGPRTVEAVGSLAALVALQELEDASERRRRALRRGALLLDLLDELRLGLLAEEVQESTLRALARGAAELEAQPNEPGLGAVLREIALRAEVELAKLEVSRAASAPEGGDAREPAGTFPPEAGRDTATSGSRGQRPSGAAGPFPGAGSEAMRAKADSASARALSNASSS
ncbi:MAG: flagellar assembly protein FliX [Geminicoccaceae bacterium]|nr:flagellar assembly protein FliX [Geminicoccaceae bacterium]